ncbi:hypothetical protein [Haloplanus halobius]|uniref:hypothetical protein n=1 Tax=Haloplanus halobius TaxID=2934938 RepID=UPI00200BA738|nr:hypothetical protein [Haloplanus sp. XH21]
MGEIRIGPPRDLITRVREAFSVESFVETGTLHGETAAWASGPFQTVVTIELGDDLYERTTERYGDIDNIEFLHGSSQEMLPGVVERLDDSAVFWLDAHYSGGETAGEEYECPLLEELAAIGGADGEQFLFIDDARDFLSPPPRPHDPDDWPTIDEVILTIRDELGPEYYIVVVEDVIVAVPPEAKDIVKSYAQDVATERWRESRVRTGARLIYTGVIDSLVTERTVALLRRTGLYPLGRKIYHVLD